MSVLYILITVGLFVLLTPGILVTLPKTKKASKYTVALVHGVIFAVVIHVIYMYVLPNLEELEGFQEGSTFAKNRPVAPQPKTPIQKVKAKIGR